MNALRHGLTAKSIVIGDEDSNEFEQLQVDLETDLQPATRLERELVGRLAGLLWRLRRVPILEAALVKARQGQLEEEQENERVERVRQEAIRRFEASHGNDMDAIYAAVMDKSYGARIGEFRKQVEAEWAESDSKTSRHQEGAAEPSGEAALLMLIKDFETALAKLNRYDVTLMSSFTRTLQLLHAARKIPNSIKVVDAY
jgi:hypothetical protein